VHLAFAKTPVQRVKGQHEATAVFNPVVLQIEFSLLVAVGLQVQQHHPGFGVAVACDKNTVQTP
jgi:hypothetical protein